MRLGIPALLLIPTGTFIGSFVAVKSGLLFNLSYPVWLAWAAGAVTLAAGALILALLASTGRRLLTVTYAALALSLLLTIVRQGSPVESAVQTAKEAGEHPGAPLASAPLSAWGEERIGFAMHPPYPGGRTVDAIRLVVPAGMDKLRLAMTQPKNALLRADGSPTRADGVEITVSGLTGGPPVELDKFPLSPARSIQQHWISRTIDLPKQATALEIRVTQGPGASTSANDTTYLAVSFGSPLVWLGERGQRLLRLLSFMLPLLAAGHLLLPILRTFRPRRLIAPETAGTWLSIGGLILAVNLLVAWWTTHGSYIYIWDHAGYWDLTRNLATTLREHGLSKALIAVANSLKREYNLLAALPPALAGVVLPDIGRRAYVILIANLYYVPACLAVYWLVRAMARQSTVYVPSGRLWYVFPLVVCAIGLYPVFLKVVLWGQPDIGGVVLVVAAILLLDTALRRITGPGYVTRSPAATRAELFSLGVLLVFVLLLLILFRRWYLFMVVSLILVGTAGLAAALIRADGRRVLMLHRGMALLAGGLTLLLASVPAFLLDRIMIMVRYSYASAYAAYSRDWPGEFDFLGEFLGIIPLGISLPLLVMGLFSPGGRPLKWLALASAPLSLLLFWKVQRGLSHHHLSLLFVGLSAATAHGVWELNRRLAGPVAQAFAAAGILLVLAIWTTGNDPAHPPGLPYAELRPPERSDLSELSRLGQFVLGELQAGKRRFCVLASNYTFSRDIVIGLWQVDDTPGLKTLDRHSVNLPQVDTRDGLPTALNECDLVLVADPVQLHLASNMQRSVSLPAEDLLGGTGVGKAFQGRPESFHLQNGVTVKVFDRAREIASEEWDSLRQRFDAPR